MQAVRLLWCTLPSLQDLHQLSHHLIDGWLLIGYCHAPTDHHWISVSKSMKSHAQRKVPREDFTLLLSSDLFLFCAISFSSHCARSAEKKSFSAVSSALGVLPTS